MNTENPFKKIPLRQNEEPSAILKSKVMRQVKFNSVIRDMAQLHTEAVAFSIWALLGNERNIWR